MTIFTAATEAKAVVRASREEIWAVLIDPDLIAQFTPFVTSITADGELWTWQMSGLDVLGVKVSPSFTERMVFDEPDRIEFHHDPPDGTRERSGVEGWYDLTEVAEGTHLATGLEISLDLPLPKVSGRAVRATMKGVIDKMGDRFSKNLLDHLGTTEA